MPHPFLSVEVDQSAQYAPDINRLAAGAGAMARFPLRRPGATAKFVTVYHLVVENALFLTGMRYLLEGCRRWGRTWDNESRHVLFGVKYLHDLMREDPERVAPVITETVKEFAPFIDQIMQPPGKNMDYYGGRHLESAWPGYTPDSLRQEMIGYANNALAKRLHAVGIEVAV